MKKIIKIIICILALFSNKVFAEKLDNPEDTSFFCCSVYDLYKTSTETITQSKDNKKTLSEQNNIDLINIEADETYRDEKKQLTILQGDTKITRGPETIRSELTNVLQLENRARLSGNVVYENEGIEITSPYAEYNTKSSRADFLSPVYKYPSLAISGKARYGIHLKNKKMHLKNSTYTTCDLLNPDWNLFSKNTELDFATGVGKGKDVYLTVKGVPVFYSPYMQFSIDEQRKTGFLVPDFNGNWTKGPDVAAPFYWNIASNMDMLIEPSYIQERGSQIKSTFRYLDTDYSGALFASYLDKDSKYVDDRYKVIIKHQQRFNPNLDVDLFYEKVSDKNYYNDFGIGISGVSTSYGSRYAKINYQKEGWNLTSRFVGYQTFDKTLTTSNQPYDVLPELGINKRWDNDYINYDIRSTISKWDHITKVDGFRSDFQFGIDKTFLMKGINVKPRIKIQHTSYDLEKQTSGLSSSPSKTIPIFSLDSEMTFSKQISKTNLAHQIKPRIFYLYSPKRNQNDIPIFDTGLNEFSFSQLFRDNSFSGLDRNSDSNQVSISLSSNFFDMKNYRNIFTTSIGQIIYFENRNISTDNSATTTRTNSNFVAELRYRPTSNTSFVSTFLFDPHATNKKTQRNIHSFQYRGDNNNIFNASYRYRKDGIEQGDISIAWGLTDRLAMLGRWNYDFKNNSSGKNNGDLEVLAGLEYESCCWKFRLIQRRFKKINTLDYEKDIQFQVMLKGFTDVGTPLGNIISRSIKGYVDREY